MTTLQRFWKKVRHQADCWVWTGAKSAKGYGFFTDEDGRLGLAHRWSYSRFRAPIPDGLTIDHLCRNPSCVNPTHLEPVTLAENVRRGTSGQVRGAQQRAKTHCPKGHPYAGENLMLQRGGKGRRCRICHNEKNRTARQRAKEM